MVQIDTRPAPNAVPACVTSWAHIGPMLSVYLAGTIAMLVAWCDKSREIIMVAKSADMRDVRRMVQALNWDALVVTLDYDGIGIGNGSLVVGGYIFSRSISDDRYIYQADPCGDPSEVEELTDERLPSDWMRDLTGIDPWTSRESSPGYLHLAEGRAIEIDPAVIPF